VVSFQSLGSHCFPVAAQLNLQLQINAEAVKAKS